MGSCECQLLIIKHYEILYRASDLLVGSCEQGNEPMGSVKYRKLVVAHAVGFSGALCSVGSVT